MSRYFFDSSALVKRYVPEIGTTWVRSVTNPQSNNTILIAHITQVEVVSAVRRCTRDASFSVRTARAIRLLMDRHSSRQYSVIGLVGSVVSLAENLLESHPLRAYDAVQLASALEANTRLISAGLSPLTFVSGDTRLLSAATSEGLQIDDPNAHP